MHRGVVCLLFSSIALAQAPKQEPFDLSIQAHWKARQEGRFDEAAARREEARSLLAHVAVDAPQFGRWSTMLAQLYEGAGMGKQAKAVLEESLSRVGVLGDSDPSRILLLNALADSWQQDRNLLKALGYREQAAAAVDAVPPAAARALGGGVTPFYLVPTDRARGFVGKLASASRRGAPLDHGYVYQSLADLYVQLGRRGAAATVVKKMHELAGNDNGALASFYERQGQLEEAAALYKKQAEQAAADPQSDPWRLIGPLQSLANLYESQQRHSEAVATLQQAIAYLETSANPELRDQTVGIPLNLARMLNQAGQTQAADQIYRQLLDETQHGRSGWHLHVLTQYADYLGATKRAAQAEELLSDYLVNNASLQPAEQSGILYALARAARTSGQQKRAGDYERAAFEKQPVGMTSPGQVSIAKELQKAQYVANAGDLDEAFGLALQAMEAAPRAVDREQVVWRVASIAASLAGKEAPDKAEQLYQRLFELSESWSTVTLQPRLDVLHSYAQFLTAHHRWDEAAGAMKRYRDALVAARGAGTGRLEEVLRWNIGAERDHGSGETALRAAQDLLALEESLSGTTSEPYLRAVETLADTYEFSGNPAPAVPLRLQAVEIGDLVYAADDGRRGFTRINAAFALARQGQFDEAERLANEAAAIGERMRHAQANPFVAQVEQIRRMRTAPQSLQRTPDGSVRWFDRTSGARLGPTPPKNAPE